MRIACTKAPGRGDTDQLLYGVASALSAKGIRVAGTAQINTDRKKDGPCDMDIQVLPNGPLLRISQSLGQGARGCRLNAGVLEDAVARVDAILDDGADCLIINKFGKQEAEGRGFRDVIVKALGLDIPVLVGMNQLNQDAFATFAGGLELQLPPDAQMLESWLLDQGALAIAV
ncbi:Nucleoside-triphosphatase THEP1 [Aliiroseovarius halocynthiae]|uniref:DUF2478 domain-containing protein n=1 Tax=Aliiroseovarius halocynthiae TaxID=985055 RepID=A0A545SU51_9RHOB|nr:DUF2478 domain-containing protein [Aliiroseovarius halocynthiae]TQV68484.1 DUF2478 domain-containing protein [Aliiroseovarius halocynthiae]SMR70881.1 Nucleoside-triphosphatase THEP1 [Aliiroseovarius halocynthiae]